MGLLFLCQFIGGDIVAKKGMINKKQMIFVTEYLQDFNAKQAAIRAGYSEKNAAASARSLMKSEAVQNYIKEKVNEITSKNIASAIEVLEYFTKVMRGESLSSVLAMDDKKQILIQKPPDQKEMLEAAKYLAKFHQLFTEKISVEGTATVVFKGEDDLKE